MTSFTRPYPGGFLDDPPNQSTPMDSAHVMNPLIDAVVALLAAVAEIAPGAPGSRVVDIAKLPVGTTAGTVAAGDAAGVGVAAQLASAALIQVAVAGVYPPRLAWPGPVMWYDTAGSVQATGGTTAGGGLGVADFDIQLLPS